MGISVNFTGGELEGDGFAPLLVEFNPDPDRALTGQTEYFATSRFLAAPSTWNGRGHVDVAYSAQTSVA